MFIGNPILYRRYLARIEQMEQKNKAIEEKIQTIEPIERGKTERKDRAMESRKWSGVGFEIQQSVQEILSKYGVSRY